MSLHEIDSEQFCAATVEDGFAAEGAFDATCLEELDFEDTCEVAFDGEAAETTFEVAVSWLLATEETAALSPCSDAAEELLVDDNAELFLSCCCGNSTLHPVNRQSTHRMDRILYFIVTPIIHHK